MRTLTKSILGISLVAVTLLTAKAVEEISNMVAVPLVSYSVEGNVATLINGVEINVFTNDNIAYLPELNQLIVYTGVFSDLNEDSPIGTVLKDGELLEVGVRETKA